ncbi:MAG: Flp pilus assembly complex ATPase component TadA [Candidatus Riflebacteria bacterium]|nr:Flp pilus assembly complex ATPase component TadA [Candidatus Riflebacteria bacterium]
MTVEKKRLGDILTDCNLITAEQVAEALKYQKANDIRLGEALIELGFVTEDDIIWALGNQLNLSCIHLNMDIIDPEVVPMISPEFALQYRIIPLYRAGNQLNVCMTDPLDSRPIEYLEKKYSVNVSVSIAKAKDFEAVYPLLYGQSASANGDMPPQIEALGEGDMHAESEKDLQTPDKVLNYILSNALASSVEKIHFETSDDNVAVRFRKHGVLMTKLEIPLKLHSEILQRVKKLSNIPEDAAESVLSGHFRVVSSNSGKRAYLSCMFYPGAESESLIISISDVENVVNTMDPSSREAIDLLGESLLANSGVLYLSGPGESGKTVTQHILLKKFDVTASKIVTIEKNIESIVPMVTQLKVGTDGFSETHDAVKLAVKLDADVIMLDCEDNADSCELLAYSAAGGKTVVISLSAVDACDSVIRLLEVVDPRLLASSLCGFAHQRLVRTLCPACKKPVEFPDELKKYLPEHYWEHKLYEPTGCPQCNSTGNLRKKMLLEYYPINSELTELIIESPDYSKLKEYGARQGIRSCEEQALQLLLDGEIAPKEFMRQF